MKSILLGLYFALLTLLFMTGISLAILHSTEFLYEFTIFHLQLEESTGLTRTFMLDHYDAVMNFLNPFSTASFSLPALSFSEHGAIHFEQCRIIFRVVYCFSIIAFLLLLLGRKYLLHKKRLQLTAFFTILLPLTLGIWFALDFDQAFYLFHLVLFPDDYWIFNPLLDPIILILPQDFFMYCGIFIVSSWLLSSIVLLVLSLITTHTSTSSPI